MSKNIFETVEPYLRSKTEHIVLVGKGGSGKSTIIQHFLNKYGSRTLTVAPTGLAASQLPGGTTIHSVFRIESGIALLSNIIKSEDNDNLIAGADYLIIDEVSMVRADLLDAIDQRCQKVRENNKPFGGLKTIMVGDPYQLEPVVNADADETALQIHLGITTRNYFFFDANVFKNLDFQKNLKIISLDTSYRQTTDTDFLEILNQVRFGKVTPWALEKLNSRRITSGDVPPDTTHLTSSNKLAREINQLARGRLNKPISFWTPEIMPLDAGNHPLLQNHKYAKRVDLCEGERVMISKNGRYPVHLCRNGEQGIIEKIDSGPNGKIIRVYMKRNNITTLCITPKVIPVTHPVYNHEKRRIENLTIAKIRTIPLDACSAITIHKAQGLTLDKVTILLGQHTLSHGQLYVALSRVRKLEDLTLFSEIQEKHLTVNPRIQEFFEEYANRTVSAS